MAASPTAFRLPHTACFVLVYPSIPWPRMGLPFLHSSADVRRSRLSYSIELLSGAPGASGRGGRHVGLRGRGLR
ncbi:hypothetical protein K525DRAFT_258808, partial [Schizophyllum commune Loenen D]